jgi:Lactate dehydrogenase and related dehydrogenases
MINLDLLKKCKKFPLIINTARGSLIDEVSLISALDNGIISGAALDVYEKEPYFGPLCKRKDVVLTPHIGSYSIEVRVKMELEAVENLICNI